MAKKKAAKATATKSTAAKPKAVKTTAVKTASATKKKKKTAVKRTRKKADSAEVREAKWQELHDEIGVGSISNYSMKETFRSNSVIEHPKFGLGFVVATHHNKIEVVFKDGQRFLVHSRP